MSNLPIEGKVTSYYGMRIHPITGVNKMHTGIDISASLGTPVNNVISGTVIEKEYDKSYGNTVVIKTSDGIIQRYAHLSSFGNYSVGDVLNSGAIVGKVGSTGSSTGNHLHYEIRKNGEAVNPLTFLDTYSTIGLNTISTGSSNEDLNLNQKIIGFSSKFSMYFIIGILLIVSLIMIFKPSNINMDLIKKLV